MTRLRRAWAWVSGDQGPMYDAQRREEQARIAHDLAMAAQTNALAEQERTIRVRDAAWDERDRARGTAVALEQDCAWLAEMLAAEGGRANLARAALVRARTDLELARANAAGLKQLAEERGARIRAEDEMGVAWASARGLVGLLAHTVEHERRVVACQDCQAVDATVADDAQVPS